MDIGKSVWIALIMGAVITLLYLYFQKKKQVYNRYHLFALVVNIFSLLSFGLLLDGARSENFVRALDGKMNLYVTTLWQPWLNQTMVFVTDLIEPLKIIFFCFILFVFLYYKKRAYHIFLLIFSLIGALTIFKLLKIIIQRLRPENGLIPETGFSFPSGHATIATVFFLILIHVLKDEIKHKFTKYLFSFISVFLLVSIGISRVYLNVHWMSDVLAGFSIGIFWITSLMLLSPITPWVHNLDKLLTRIKNC